MNQVLRLAVSLSVVSFALAGCVADDTDGGALSPPEVIKVGADSARGGLDVAASAEMAAEEPTSEEAAADMSMDSSYLGMWTVVTDFVVSDSMPALPAMSTGYVYRQGSTVPEATALALAAALGVDTEPQERPAEYMVEWAFGPDDGTAPSLSIDASGQHYWWYSSGWDDMRMSEDVPACTESVDADGNVTVECPKWEPEPPVDVPSAQEAESRARDIISAAGFDPAFLTIEVYADEWYASVYATQPISDVLPADSASGANWSFGFGANGVLEYAGGSFVLPEAVGPYPLVDLDTAIDRLTEMYLAGAAYPMAIEAMPAIDEPAMDEPLPEPLPAPAEEPSEEPAIDPAEGGVPFEPTEVTVTLIDVTADLWWANDVDGNVWLVPAYRFIGDDGNWYTVPAVTDEYLIETPTYDVAVEESMPADGAGTTGAAGSSVVVPSEISEMLAPLDLSSVDPYILESVQAIVDGSLVVSEDVFADAAVSYGLEVRVVERDGEAMMVTEDYREDRINVAVVDGNVVAITGIG